jgi:probable selenium-dependent hydroxylase accessory protein YqeC
MPADCREGADPTRGLAELAALVEGSAEKGPRVVSLVGGGGKTSAMFALGRHFAKGGARVLAATTTRILDPERASGREGRGFGKRLVMEDPASSAGRELLRSASSPLVLGSRSEGGKLLGVAPEDIDALADLFDLILVEADGSRGLPIKAPASHEPVLPGSSALVIGVIGLDALGRPMDGRTVHRPELFGPLVGCAPGELITAAHLARLVASSEGLFKGAPEGSLRVVLLNKADLAASALAASCREAIIAESCVDEVVLGAIGAARETASR